MSPGMRHAWWLKYHPSGIPNMAYSGGEFHMSAHVRIHTECSLHFIELSPLSWSKTTNIMGFPGWGAIKPGELSGCLGARKSHVSLKDAIWWISCVSSSCPTKLCCDKYTGTCRDVAMGVKMQKISIAKRESSCPYPSWLWQNPVLYPTYPYWRR